VHRGVLRNRTTTAEIVFGKFRNFSRKWRFSGRLLRRSPTSGRRKMSIMSCCMSVVTNMPGISRCSTFCCGLGKKCGNVPTDTEYSKPDRRIVMKRPLPHTAGIERLATRAACIMSNYSLNIYNTDAVLNKCDTFLHDQLNSEKISWSC
jgi:hypothetical protein